MDRYQPTGRHSESRSIDVIGRPRTCTFEIHMNKSILQINFRSTWASYLPARSTAGVQTDKQQRSHAKVQTIERGQRLAGGEGSQGLKAYITLHIILGRGMYCRGLWASPFHVLPGAVGLTSSHRPSNPITLSHLTGDVSTQTGMDQQQAAAPKAKTTGLSAFLERCGRQH